LDQLLGYDPQSSPQVLWPPNDAAAEQLLDEIGCPKINLQVRKSNAAVVALYESLGYATDDVVSMGKRLHID
jgi:hypothetical protein